MLRGINPLINPDLMHILRAMGHGDELAIVDANFPAVTNANRLVRLDGVDAVKALRAVLSLLPLDTFVECPAHVMQVVGDPDAVEPIMEEFQKAIDEDSLEDAQLGKIERFAFYDRVKECFAVIATSETRLYGNIILTKGIIRPEEQLGD